MWFLGELFDDVLDIVSIPVKVTASVWDKVLNPFDNDGVWLRDWVDSLRESVRLNK